MEPKFQGRCNREKPACKYFHPPQHLKDQLLINGRNHLALKNALAQQMQQQIIPGQMPAATMVSQNWTQYWKIQPSPVRLAVCFSAAHLLALPARPGVPPAPGQRWPDCSPAVSSSTPTPGSPADTAAAAAATTGQTAQRPH